MAKTDGTEELHIGTQINIVRGLSKEQYALLLEMSRCANNVWNTAVFEARQFYFATQKIPAKNDLVVLTEANENGCQKDLQSACVQQTARKVHGSFASFRALRTKKKKGQYQKRVCLPGYREKGGFAPIIITGKGIFLKDGCLKVPQSRTFRKEHGGRDILIRFPRNLLSAYEEGRIRQIELVPAKDGTYFKLLTTYYTEEKKKPILDQNKVLAGDLGVNNFLACITSSGTTFLVNGRRIKSINHYYNQRKAQKQFELSGHDRDWSRALTRLTLKRENQIRDFLHKTAKYLVDYCLERGIGTIIIGYNKGWKDKCSMGKIGNQRFVQIPHGRFLSILEDKCDKAGIRFVATEESYTSKASAIDNDFVPTYDQNAKASWRFSGKRVKRGLYRSKDGYLVNADINGAWNIMRKGKQNGDLPHTVVVPRLCKGVLDTPQVVVVK